MRAVRELALGVLWLCACARPGVEGQRSAPVEARVASPGATHAPASAAPAPSRGAAALPIPSESAAALPTEPPATVNEWGRADLDPDNDGVVAPPEVIPECEALLTAQGAEFAPAHLPLRRSRNGRECGTAQAVSFRGVKGGARYSPTPVLSCGMALALARFEPKLQSAATQALGGRVVRVRHLGTYNCREMARFDLVSEHSYANAIDVSELVLESGRTVSVERHFGRPSGEPRGAEGRFLRELAQRAFDDADFSCVITEFFDPLHRNHIHLDLARYRVDGTR